MNRHTAIQGVACAGDILGNRLTLGSNTYGCDPLNRMTSYNSCAYAYRADGMPVSKTVSGVTTRYRCDGQMGIEDSDSSGNVKQYGLGARGIDSITNPSAGVMYPIYDGHGSRRTRRKPSRPSSNSTGTRTPRANSSSTTTTLWDG